MIAEIIQKWEERPRRQGLHVKETFGPEENPARKFLNETRNYVKQTKEKIMSIIEKIKRGFKDIATLDVVTLTGDITVETAKNSAAEAAPTAATKDEKTSWETLLTDVGDKVFTQKLSVVAYTHSQWDCDSVNFVKFDPTPGDKLLIEAHKETVKSAHESRRAAVKMLADVADLK